MMRRNWAFSCALVLSAASVVACGNGDDSTSPLPTGDAAAPTQDAGDAPDSSVVDTGADASADAGADATVGDATADGATADGATADADAGEARDTGAADASDGGLAHYAIFVGSDFTNAELSVVSLNPDALLGNLALADQDSVASASGGLGFVLARGAGTVLELDSAMPATAGATIDVNDRADAASYASNPYAVVVTTGSQAYVTRYNANSVAVVNLASGLKTGTIDLSAFMAPDDTDGLVEVSAGAYDPTTQRIYLLLQRIDEYANYQGPDGVPPCLASHPEIIAIDPATDAVAPLTDAGNGAIDLLGENPETLVADFANGRLLVSQGGCYGEPDGGDAGSLRFGRGVESVAIASATPTWLYQTSGIDLVSGLVYVDSAHAYLEVGGQWFPWNPAQTTLGATAVANFPQAAFYDGAGRIVGLSGTAAAAGSDAGNAWSVVAMSTATGAFSTLVTSPFKHVDPAIAYGVSSAFVR